MIAKNYYNVLGLNPSCALKDIKKSYHKLALVWHPDKHCNKTEAQSKFTEINEAYSILADDKKRMIYDSCGLEGLVMEQELRDFADSNTFYQKGFQGTDKSAFDVLRDIFEESDDEDDDFFDDCNLFNLSDNFKENIKAFIDENIIPSETEEGDTFFKNYIPTFMDADFFCQPPSLFEQIIPDEDDSSDETEFFTYFTCDSYSKKSTTVNNHKKVKTSSRQKVQKGNTIYEDQEYHEYTTELGPRPSKKTRNDKSKYVEEVVFDEEDFAEIFEKSKNSQRKAKKQSKNVQESGKMKGRLHSELDGEEEKGKKYNQKNQKKNKK